MGERKVLNKYFPPDFDPSKLPRGKRVRGEEKQMKVRMMLPMSVRCNTCGNFMYKGTKFNTRMEDVKGETYLGLKIFRFYYRCTNCSAEFCMKTDPKTADYIVEGGASRNYEPWRDKEQDAAQTAAQREEEEKGNAMKALENRTLDSKREMDILTALDEMRSLKARHEVVDTDAALAALRRAAEKDEPVDLDAEDEAAVRQMLLQRAGFVQRLSDSDGSERDSDGDRQGDFTGGGAASMEGVESGGREAKRSRNLGPSVAAAAWADDEGEDGGDGAHGDGNQAGGSKPGVSNAAGEVSLRENSTREGNGTELGRGNRLNTSAGGVGGRGGASRGQQLHHGAAEQRSKEQQQKVMQPPPPSVPSFSARPAAVLVKKKVVAKPVLVVEKKKGEEEEEGNALLGLVGYGSSENSE